MERRATSGTKRPQVWDAAGQPIFEGHFDRSRPLVWKALRGMPALGVPQTRQPVPQTPEKLMQPSDQGHPLLGVGCGAAPPSRRRGSLPTLSTVVERLEPVAWDVAEYLAGSPRDFSGLVSASKSLSVGFEEKAEDMWRAAFASRWPGFYDHVSACGDERTWKELYRETAAGSVSFLMEVFEREKMPGFTMAAMSAWVTHAPATKTQPAGFVARYISASLVTPEFIPHDEAHRLRFCPDAVAGVLEAGKGITPDGQIATTAYPYRILEGVGDLVVGQGVELQWKMQWGSPFGWWYGKLESLEVSEDSRTAVATIIFEQFPRTTRWHQLEVRFGDGEMRSCAFGGYCGGLRAVSKEEERHWMRFFPRVPLLR